MDWITDGIAIGNYLDAQDAGLLRQYGLRSALSLDATLTAKRAAELGLVEIASYQLVDGVGNDPRVFNFAVKDLLRLVECHSPVLVQCHAGRSRSAVVVAAYLMRAQGIAAEAAIEAVAAKREINVTAGLMDLLHKLET